MSLASSFWEQIDKTSWCWNWGAALDTGGYGHLRVGGKLVRAHRHIWASLYGPIPDGLHVLHSCDNRKCCRPSHLFLGTHQDNMTDMKAKDRRKGVAYGEDNGRAILTAEQVKIIRADQRGTRTIAKDYEVSRSQIQRIKAGKQWLPVASLSQLP